MRLVVDCTSLTLSWRLREVLVWVAFECCSGKYGAGSTGPEGSDAIAVANTCPIGVVLLFLIWDKLRGNNDMKPDGEGVGEAVEASTSGDGFAPGGASDSPCIHNHL
jgi:hypothetical protein